MSAISCQAFEQNPIALLERAEAGETFQIVRAGRAIAELRPVVQPPAALRPIGLCAGEFSVPDDFDSPPPDEIIREFEGS